MSPARITHSTSVDEVVPLARQWVDVVAATVADEESAHMSEDALWHGALSWIGRNGVDHPEVAAELARVAGDSRLIEYSRWYA